MFRLRTRHIFLVLTASVLLVIVFQFFHVSYAPKLDDSRATSCAPIKAESSDHGAHKVSCLVDGLEKLQCLRDDDDIYFPFEGFLKKRFDVSGHFSKGANGAERFEWFTSYSRVRYPDFEHYDPAGPFGHFASYSVETRDRVRCISARYGVPMSTQWSQEPYFYPIQIAQFALQHYSRSKSNPQPSITAIGASLKDWVVGSTDEVTVLQQVDTAHNFPYTEVVAKDPEGGANLRLNESADMSIVSFYWKPDKDASFTVIAELVQRRVTYELRYVQKDDSRCVWHDDDSRRIFYYSLGRSSSSETSSDWRFVCRDVLVDVGRALAAEGPRRGAPLLHPGDVRGLYVSFNGHASIRNLTQRSSAHLEHFTVAADWFLANQNDRGGWSVPVERSIAEKRLVLRAGWHSAMAQGHALSVLTRAYAISKDVKYLQAAQRALSPFQTAASEGGVRNELFGYPWFEEYPTTPGSFVLNGFMYSLIGLFDLSQASAEYGQLADKLFHEGMESLRILLPLFDTGSGSAYDLRHVGLHSSPNLARWDYHTVHIYLLKWLHSITAVEELNETAVRWAAYAQGGRAKHN